MIYHSQHYIALKQGYVSCIRWRKKQIWHTPVFLLKRLIWWNSFQIVWNILFIILYQLSSETLVCKTQCLHDLLSAGIKDMNMVPWELDCYSNYHHGTWPKQLEFHEVFFTNKMKKMQCINHWSVANTHRGVYVKITYTHYSTCMRYEVLVR